MAIYAFNLEKQALQRDLYHLARHMDTRKSTFEYVGDKKEFGQKFIFIVIIIFFLIKTF